MPDSQDSYTTTANLGAVTFSRDQLPYIAELLQLQKEVAEYRKIGTIDECRAAMECDAKTAVNKIRKFIKREINPYGKPFEGSSYELGIKILDYLEKQTDGTSK